MPSEKAGIVACCIALTKQLGYKIESEKEVRKMATFCKSVKVVSAKVLPVQSSANSGVKQLRRFQSTITLTSLPQSQKDTYKHQSLPLSDTKDFSTQVQSDFEVFNHAVLSAQLAHQPQQLAREIDIMEFHQHNFDKILLLINHGEAAVKKNDPHGLPVLTGKGVGQALSLSHKTSIWCNSDTGLSPELVVFAPLGCSIQTALHAFPYNSPDSVRGVSWVCRGDLLTNQEEPVSSSTITKNFPGMDLSLYETQYESDDFLEWIRGRQERVIVGKSGFVPSILTMLLRRRISHAFFITKVSSTSSWLESFCKSTLGCGSLEFKDGAVMRAVGLY